MSRGLPLAVSALCLLALTMRLDWGAVGAALWRTDWSLAVGAALLTLASIGLRAWRWRLLLGPHAPPWHVVLGTYAMSVAAGLALPASGELTRALLLGRRGTPRTSFVLASVAVEKALDLAVTLALLAVALLLAGTRLPGALGVATALGLPVLLLVALLLVWLTARLAEQPRGLPAPLAAMLVRLALALGERLARFRAGLLAIARLGWPVQIAVVLLTLAVWAAAILATLGALGAFGLPADWRLAATLYGALLLGLSVPAAPGALGTWELVCVAVLDAWGLPLAASGAFAVGFHALAFAPPLLAGALAWLVADLTPQPPSLRGKGEQMPPGSVAVSRVVPTWEGEEGQRADGAGGKRAGSAGAPEAGR